MINDVASTFRSIDREFMKLYLQNNDMESLFARSESISGEFFLEGLDIRIAISDSEMDDVLAAQDILTEIKSESQQVNYSSEKIEEAKYIYTSFMQAHNHELAHLYQVLALPAFQMVWATRYNWLRFEAAVMLRYFEHGGSFRAESHYKILQILEDDQAALLDEFSEQFNSFANPYRMYIADYKNQHKGISLFYIVESMAHIISLQLSDTPEVDVLNLEVSEEYSAAFRHFDNYLGEIEVQLRWKYLVFLYICYFSCQHFNTDIDHPINAAVDVFLSLCSKAKFYIETLAKLYQRYERYSLRELKELNQWPLSNDEIDLTNQQQLAGIYALFELIDILENQAFPDSALQKSLTVNALSDFFSVSDAKGVDWSNKYTLARMLIFPANFVWTREIYDEVMGFVGTGKEFTYEQEATFYRFIMNCKCLLQARDPIPCCEEHGMRDQYKKVLRCKNEGGLAFYLQELTGKPAHELFKF